VRLDLEQIDLARLGQLEEDVILHSQGHIRHNLLVSLLAWHRGRRRANELIYHNRRCKRQLDDGLGARVANEKVVAHVQLHRPEGRV